MEEKCFKHFYILHLYDSVLFSNVHRNGCFNYPQQTSGTGVGVDKYCAVYELVNKSNFVLLAFTRTSNCSFKDNKKTTTQTNRGKLTRPPPPEMKTARFSTKKVTVEAFLRVKGTEFVSNEEKK